MRPTIKAIAVVALLTLLFLRPALALDNSIYIQQSGDNSAITMTQDGAGNVIRGIQSVGTGNTTPSVINGNTNTVTVNQVGVSNTLDMGIKTSVQNGSTSGNQFSYAIYGNNSVAVIDSNNNGQNLSASNTMAVTQTGDYSSANINMLGGLNTVTATTSGGTHNRITSTVNGDNNTQTIGLSGGGNNAITVNQGIGGSALPPVNSSEVSSLATTNNNGTVTLTVVGASNTVGIAQTGGTNVTVASLNGSSNTATIVQSAIAGNTTINLNSTGNGNTFTLTSTAR